MYVKEINIINSTHQPNRDENLRQFVLESAVAKTTKAGRVENRCLSWCLVTVLQMINIIFRVQIQMFMRSNQNQYKNEKRK